jgi:hypothetical protein
VLGIKKKEPAASFVSDFHGGLLITGHLTEDLLGVLLRWKSGEENVRSQYVIPGTRYRLDYVVALGGRWHESIAVEFDGPGHYTSAQQVHRDMLKDSLAGMPVIRIPLWLQLDRHTSDLIGLHGKLYVKTAYPHGWVRDKVYPASYCAAGFDRFVREIKQFTTLDGCEVVVQVLSGLLEHEKTLKEVVLTSQQLAVVQDLLVSAKAVECGTHIPQATRTKLHKPQYDKASPYRSSCH